MECMGLFTFTCTLVHVIQYFLLLAVASVVSNEETVLSEGSQEEGDQKEVTMNEESGGGKQDSCEKAKAITSNVDCKTDNCK